MAPPLASERDEFLRAAWRVMVSGEVCARRLVFVDEMGSNTSLFELYAYSPRGERAYCSVARNRGKNTTLLASMSLSGMCPSMVVEGGADGAVFETYLREALLPTLGEGNEMEDSFESVALNINSLFRVASATTFPAISFTPISVHRTC